MKEWKLIRQTVLLMSAISGIPVYIVTGNLVIISIGASFLMISLFEWLMNNFGSLNK